MHPNSKNFLLKTDWNVILLSYFENVMRFVAEGYVPTEDDCIMARVRTTGIVVTEFDEGPVHFS